MRPSRSSASRSSWGRSCTEESFGGTIFLYYDAWIVGGSFGTGSWPDHALLTDRERERSGTHEPVWVPLEELRGLDVRPRALGALLAP